MSKQCPTCGGCFEAEQLRALADHLESRHCSPSLTGYCLVDGLRAAAALLDGQPGPNVHPDVEPGSDKFLPHVSLRELLGSGPPMTPRDSNGPPQWRAEPPDSPWRWSAEMPNGWILYVVGRDGSKEWEARDPSRHGPPKPTHPSRKT